MELLRQGVQLIERELQAQHGRYWGTKATAAWRNELSWRDHETPHLDIAGLIKLMWEQWNEVFRKTLSFAERSLVSALRDLRNKCAHQEPVSTDDAYRVLDSAARGRSRTPYTIGRSSPVSVGTV